MRSYRVKADTTTIEIQHHEAWVSRLHTEAQIDQSDSSVAFQDDGELVLQKRGVCVTTNFAHARAQHAFYLGLGERDLCRQGVNCLPQCHLRLSRVRILGVCLACQSTSGKPSHNAENWEQPSQATSRAKQI